MGTRLGSAALAACGGYLLGAACGALVVLAYGCTSRLAGGWWQMEVSRLLILCLGCAGPVLAFQVGGIAGIVLDRAPSQMRARCLSGTAAALGVALLAGLAGGLQPASGVDAVVVAGTAACVVAFAAGAGAPGLGERILRWSFVDRAVALGAAVVGLWLLWRWGR